MSRFAPRLHFGLLAALVVVVGHSATLAIGEATSAAAQASLQATGHGAAWGLAVAAILTGASALGMGVAWRLHALRRRLVDLTRALPRPRPLRIAELGPAWRNLFLAALAAFVAQENAEHLLAHGHLPGVAVLLDGQYAVAIPTFAAVALIVAGVWIACRQRVTAISEALAVAERLAQRPPHAVRRPVDRTPDRRAINRQRNGPAARRAPPWSLPV